MRRVGILGGGQLCLMLADALHKLGAEVRVYEPDPDAPARRRLPYVASSAWDDARELERFFRSCDVVTYEMEHVPADPLRPYAARGLLVPGLDILRTTQDRILEKQFLSEAGLAPVPFVAVHRADDLDAAAARFGVPFVLKRARGGYDGKGQAVVRTAAELPRAVRAAACGAPSEGWVLEDLLEIETEISCIVARSADGQTVAFPLLENLHRDHVLDFTVMPARVPAALAEAARAVAEKAAERLGLVGVLTVEFLIGRSSREGGGGGPAVYVNELAPRPHNSGHVTRNGCSLSQFDALARVLTGVPLTQPRMVGDASYCMGNLLGEVWGAQGRRGDLDLSAWRDNPQVAEVYLYGKRHSSARRKMGHFVTRAPSGDTAIAAAAHFRTQLVDSSFAADARREPER